MGGADLTENKVCNRCGKILDFFDKQQNFFIHTKLGYGSIFDGETVYYQLCCDCIDKVINECVIQPIATEKGTQKC